MALRLQRKSPSEANPEPKRTATVLRARRKILGLFRRARSVVPARLEAVSFFRDFE